MPLLTSSARATDRRTLFRRRAMPLGRTGIIVGLSLAGMAAGVVPAFADGWGYSDCSQYPNPGCELGVGEGGRGAVSR
jgi:hypothetical protein